ATSARCARAEGRSPCRARAISRTAELDSSERFAAGFALGRRRLPRREIGRSDRKTDRLFFEGHYRRLLKASVSKAASLREPFTLACRAQLDGRRALCF